MRGDAAELGRAGVMRYFCGRIEANVEAERAEDLFVPCYLTGAAEWSMDRAAAYVGSREACKALGAIQPLPFLLVELVEPPVRPAAVYEATCARMGEHDDE